MSRTADLLAVVDGQESALLALEARINAAAVGPLRTAIDAILRDAVLAAARLAPGDSFEPILTMVREQLDALAALDVGAALSAGFAEALAAGLAAGVDQVLDRQAPRVRDDVPPEIVAVADNARATVADKLRRGATALFGVSTVPQLITAVAVARHSVTAVERAASWGTNRAVAEGTTRVAVATGADRVWVAERDACVHCLAYAGKVAPAGGAFPTGLTFGDKPLSRDPVPNAPLHPACRCRVMLWRKEFVEPGVLPLPAALEREARRSIVRGFSLPGESEPARLRAADRLLRQGAELPNSVEEYGARAVRKGGFPRGRNVPTGRPAIR